MHEQSAHPTLHLTLTFLSYLLTILFKQTVQAGIMKITTILIYATLYCYANISFSHENHDSLILHKYATRSLKNLIIHSKPKPVPEFVLLGVDNASEIVKLGSEQVTVINFWATWCAPFR